ncbi:MAG: hypothetical protein QG559_247 [Campylobacterota bacterium]|nr:hypothetical protein [Campylobacterota bacterium]
MKSSKAKAWPYAIAISIFLIFLASVATIVIASKAPVQKSNDYMMDYHEADERANEIIKESIEFNKKYKVEFLAQDFNVKNTILKYRISDTSLVPIDNASIKVILTRPDTHKHNIELDKYEIENGVYTFSMPELPQEGRWDIIAKIKIDDLERFYNIKTDTRTKTAVEY